MRWSGALVALSLLSAAGCGGEVAASRERIEEHLVRAAQLAKDKAPDYARTLRDSASCLGSEIDDRLGRDDAQALLETRGDLSRAPEQLQRSADKLKLAVQACIDVRPTLISAFMSAGLDQRQAECVADRALSDDKILTPLLVNIVFGDPGVGTAIAVAVRAAQGCVSADDLKRLFP